MSQEILDITGVAYICSSLLPDHPELLGVLVTSDRTQFTLVGRQHSCSPNDPEDEDHHTCCFDDSCQKLDLEVTRIHFNDFKKKFVLPHVMKTGEDNFTLTSKHVQFFTDDLLIGEDAQKVAVKYISDRLEGKDCLVCIGEMKIKFPQNS